MIDKVFILILIGLLSSCQSADRSSHGLSGSESLSEASAKSVTYVGTSEGSENECSIEFAPVEANYKITMTADPSTKVSLTESRQIVTEALNQDGHYQFSDRPIRCPANLFSSRTCELSINVSTNGEMISRTSVVIAPWSEFGGIGEAPKVISDLTCNDLVKQSPDTEPLTSSGKGYRFKLNESDSKVLFDALVNIEESPMIGGRAKIYTYDQRYLSIACILNQRQDPEGIYECSFTGQEVQQRDINIQWQDTRRGQQLRASIFKSDDLYHALGGEDIEMKVALSNGSIRCIPRVECQVNITIP